MSAHFSVLIYFGNLCGFHRADLSPSRLFTPKCFLLFGTVFSGTLAGCSLLVGTDELSFGCWFSILQLCRMCLFFLTWVSVESLVFSTRKIVSLKTLFLLLSRSGASCPLSLPSALTSTSTALLSRGGERAPLCCSWSYRKSPPPLTRLLLHGGGFLPTLRVEVNPLFWTQLPEVSLAPLGTVPALSFCLCTVVVRDVSVSVSA